MALGIPLATIEFAILDMLGRIANKSMGQLIGEIHHPQVAVYQATEYREKSVEESLELIKTGRRGDTTPTPSRSRSAA